MLKSQLQPGDAVPRPPRESGWRGQRAQRGWVGVLPGSQMWSQLRCICPCNALTEDDAFGSTERSEMVKSMAISFGAFPLKIFYQNQHVSAKSFRNFLTDLHFQLIVSQSALLRASKVTQLCISNPLGR